MSKEILKVFNELIETVEKSSTNNEAKITNVKLWVESWKKEMELACKSDSEQLPNMTLEQAIEKAKPNMDKIKDVDKHLDDIR
jgi:hypothetical protein